VKGKREKEELDIQVLSPHKIDERGKKT